MGRLIGRCDGTPGTLPAAPLNFYFAIRMELPSRLFPDFLGGIENHFSLRPFHACRASLPRFGAAHRHWMRRITRTWYRTLRPKRLHKKDSIS